MTQLSRYNKFFAALVPAVVGLAPLINPDLAFVGDPEWQAAVGLALAPVLTFAIPNRDEPEVEAAKERARLTKRVRRGA